MITRRPTQVEHEEWQIETLERCLDAIGCQTIGYLPTNPSLQLVFAITSLRRLSRESVHQSH